MAVWLEPLLSVQVMLTSSPGEWAAIAARSWVAVVVRVPPTEVIVSPACDAGVGGRGAVVHALDGGAVVAEPDAEEGGVGRRT